MFIDFISIAYALISDSLYAPMQFSVAMNPFTCSGLSKSQLRSICRNLFPTASIVESAYASFFRYHSVSKSLFAWDVVFFTGDDVAVPDRP